MRIQGVLEILYMFSLRIYYVGIDNNLLIYKVDYY
jgi:hypothetical protein